MKRGLILLVFLVLMPSVLAAISLDPISRDRVNLGDNLQVSGKISVSSDMFVLLKLILDCEQSDIPLLIRSISLTANKDYSISENLQIPIVEEGACTIRTELEKSGNIIETSRSSTFTITKELKGEFDIPSNTYQLGDRLTLKGKIQRLNGDLVNGFGTLYLRSNGTIAFADSVQVNSGSFSYARSTTDMPAGSHTLQFDVQDSYGNKVLLDLGSLTIENRLTISSVVNKELFLPGEKVEVSGSVKKFDDTPADSGEVTADFNNQTYKDTFTRGYYSISFTIPPNSRSGDHGIDVVVRDSFGNIGSAFLKAAVTQVPTSLKLVLPETTLTPKSALKLTPVLYDQAEDKIFKDVLVEVTDAKGKKQFSENVPADKELTLELPADAAPGEWAASVRLDKLKETVNFEVVENIALGFDLVNQTLYITNIGNVKFKSTLDFIFSGPTNVTKTKKLSLNVDETESINLGSGLEDGVYDIEVYGKTFNGVYIEGTSSFTWILYIIIGLLVLLILHIGRNFFKLHRKHQHHLREMEKGKITVKKIIQHKQETAPKPKKSFTEGAREFRDRILRDVIKRDKEQTQKELRDKFQKEYIKK